jgi:excisionase family DNA binding protein
MLRRMTKNVLTVGKAATELGVSPSMLRQMCERGLVRGAVRIGRWWRIPREEVERIRVEGAPFLGRSDA